MTAPRRARRVPDARTPPDELLRLVDPGSALDERRAVGRDGPTRITGSFTLIGTSSSPDPEGQAPLWDIATGAAIRPLSQHNSGITDLAIALDGQTMRIANQNKTAGL